MLNDQAFHKSIVLITQVEEDFVVGFLLNHPSPDVVEFDTSDQKGLSRVTQRYGGKFGLKGDSEKATFWFHFNKELKAAGIGSPVAESGIEGIWICTIKQVVEALRSGIASENDFICVKGLSLWPGVLGMARLKISSAVIRRLS